MEEFSTLNEVLAARSTADRSIFFIEGKQDTRKLSYAQLYANSLYLLHDLQESGLRAGDHMILLLRDNQRFIEVYWACLLGGIIPVPVAVGISDEHRAKVLRIFNKLERPHLYTTQADLDRLVAWGRHNNMAASVDVLLRKTVIDELLDDHDVKGKPYIPAADETAFIQFSSGSTSEPKGVVLSHRNLLTNMRAICVGSAHSENDIGLSWMPLTHDMGLIGFHLNMMLVGVDQYLMPTELFSRRPVLWMQKVSEHRATVLFSPNFGYKHYLKALGDNEITDLDLSSVRLIYNGAEPISVDLCEQYLTRLAPAGLRRETMFTVYGLAEATLAVSFPTAGAPYRTLHVDRHAMRLGECVNQVPADHADAVTFAIEGGPVPDMEIRITDTNWQPLEAWHTGLVQIRGPSVTSGYYLEDELNRRTISDDGWLDTGDVGFLTDDGELVITGREKDILFANGQNYYPHDIEAVALQLPELELGKVVATGVRQPNADADLLLIFVLYRADIADFHGVVRDIRHHISEQTGLEVSHVLPVKRIPKTTSGKLQRRALGEAFLRGEFDAAIEALAQIPDTETSAGENDLTPRETKIKLLFQEVVKDRGVGVDDNFFEMGISSLTLAEVHQNIDQNWPGLVDITDLFEFQTIRELATHMESKH